MRKINCLVAVLAVMSLFGCQKYDTAESAAPYSIKASLEIPDGTKAEIGSDGTVLWNEGDVIYVIPEENDKRYTFTLSSGAGTANAVFTSTSFTSDLTPRYASYNVVNGGNPKPEVSTTTGYDLNFELSSLSEEATVKPAMFAKWNSSTETFKFKNATGILRLQLKGDVTVGGIMLISNKFESLFCNIGRGLVKFAEDGSISKTSVAIDNQDRNKLFKQNLNAALSATEPTTFDFAVPAGCFSEGFTVLIQDATGRYIKTLRTTASNTIGLSQITVMPVQTVTQSTPEADGWTVTPADYILHQSATLNTGYKPSQTSKFTVSFQIPETTQEGAQYICGSRVNNTANTSCFTLHKPKDSGKWMFQYDNESKVYAVSTAGEQSTGVLGDPNPDHRYTVSGWTEEGTDENAGKYRACALFRDETTGVEESSSSTAYYQAKTSKYYFRLGSLSISGTTSKNYNEYLKVYGLKYWQDKTQEMSMDLQPVSLTIGDVVKTAMYKDAVSGNYIGANYYWSGFKLRVGNAPVE